MGSKQTDSIWIKGLEDTINVVCNMFLFKKKLFFLYIIGGLFLLPYYSCSGVDDNQYELTEDTVRIFRLGSPEGIFYEPFMVNDSSIHFFIPQEVNLRELRLSVPSTDELKINNKVYYNGDIVDLSDLLNPAIYYTNCNGGHSSKVIIYYLPVFMIITPDSLPIDSKDIRKEGCIIQLVDEKGYQDIGTAGIKGRGASTWNQPKKPYNIKLDKKKDILGMPKSKHWILLANAYYDRTQLHNATAYEIARYTDFPWVQSGRYVELILNGDHKGLYYLCEKIHAEKGKIELTKPSEKTNATEVGYLLESCVYLAANASKLEFPKYFFETPFFNKTGQHTTLCNLGWQVKEPEEEDLQQAQFDYIKNEMIKLEQLITDSIDSGKYRELFDVESAVNWWLVEELCLNEEASRTKNVYIYREGGVFHIGPPWDFDAWTFGLYGTELFYCNQDALYYRQLFKDPYFVKRVKEKWTLYKPIWEAEIPKYIDEQFSLIYNSAKRNEKMWPNWHPINCYPEKSYDQIISEMKDSFLKQLKWMNLQINNM